MNKILLSFGAALLLTLSACGGGGGAATTAATIPTVAAGTAVTLTGIVANGTSAGGVAVGAVGAGAGTTTVKGYYPGAIVIAVDKYGNSITTTADNAGKFTLNLKTGVSYGLMFINPKTLKVIGSLVQATAQTTAGAIALNGNGNLGVIVINPTSGHAVSTNQATGQLNKTSVVSAKAAGLNTNANGTITPANVANMQTTTVANNPAALKTISLKKYFAQPNTWWESKNIWDATNNYYSMDVTVADTANIKGPHGALVAATKEASVQYYTRQSYGAANGVQQGYFTLTTAANSFGFYNATTMPNLPAAFNTYANPFSWGYYSWSDIPNNTMYEISNSSQTKTWAKFGADQVVLGKANKRTFKDTYSSGTDSFTVTLAKTPIFTGLDGVKRPVMDVAGTTIETLTPTACANQNKTTAQCTNLTRHYHFYGIRGIGGTFDAGTTASPITLSTALAKLQFGTVNINPTTKAVTFTNINPYAKTSPVSTKLSVAQRDSLLTYAWKNRSQIGSVITKNTNGTTKVQTPWFSQGSITDHTPNTWSNANAISFLPAGKAQTFTFNNITVSNASGSPVTLNLELVDMFFGSTLASAGNPKVLSSVILQTIQSAAATAAPSVLNGLKGTFTLPTVASLSLRNTLKAFNVKGDAGQVQLSLALKDNKGNILMEWGVDNYLIQ